ncbi:MAG: hypothetical protein ACJA2S_005679 [Cyclobacteriaceae bacterium]|jgi:hypothetical protein
MMIIKVLAVFSSLSFLYYGIVCLYSKEMVLEFKRFGVHSWQRVLTGILQVLGGIGLIVGLMLPVIGLMASIGLSALMFLGFIVRLKIKDGLIKSLPSFLYMILNIWLSMGFFQLL